MQAVPPGNTTRIAQLDTLRGVAALLVLVHHSVQAYARSTEDTFAGLMGWLDIGRMGVVIFFMISGFVIVKAVPGHDAAAAGTFLKHRFFRLYPPFWVSVAVAVVTAALIGQTPGCVFSVPVTPAGLVANLTMLPLRFHQTALIGIYWTLELEALFYLLVVGIALSRQIGYVTMCASACTLFVAAVAVAGLRALTHGTSHIGDDDVFLALLHLSMMFSGGAVRCYWDAQTTRGTFFGGMPVSLKFYYLMVAAFFAGVAAIKLRHGFDPHTFRVAATYLLSIAAFLGCLRYWNGSWLGTVLGNRSYGLYLLHLPVAGLLSLMLYRLPGWHLSYLGYLAIVVAVSLAGADMLRRLVERPAIRFAHRSERRSRRAPIPASPFAPLLAEDRAPALLRRDGWVPVPSAASAQTLTGGE